MLNALGAGLPQIETKTIENRPVASRDLGHALGSIENNTQNRYNICGERMFASGTSRKGSPDGSRNYPRSCS